MDKFMNNFESVWRFFLDLVFPADKETALIEGLGVEKFMELARKSTHCCRFEKKFIFSSTEIDIYFLYSYRNKIVKDLIWQLKYRNSRRLARFVAEVLMQEMYECFEQFKKDLSSELPILIPIPLSKKRLAERGYNHVGLLAKELIDVRKRNGQQFFELDDTSLKKTRHTPTQASIRNKQQRLKNLENCFTVGKEKIIGRNVILIDDVVTTGTTLREAAKTLKQAGAGKIICIVLAH
jgi:ComF family protein